MILYISIEVYDLIFVLLRELLSFFGIRVDFLFCGRECPSDSLNLMVDIFLDIIEEILLFVGLLGSHRTEFIETISLEFNTFFR